MVGAEQQKTHPEKVVLCNSMSGSGTVDEHRMSLQMRAVIRHCDELPNRWTRQQCAK